MRRRRTVRLHPTVQSTVYQRNRSRMGVCVCVCVSTPLINISPTHTPPNPLLFTHTTLKGPLWWWWRKDVAVWVIECCWSRLWAHPCSLSPSGRPTAARWPGGTSLKASSRHTAAGRAALSDSETALPTYNSCIAAARGGRILHKNGTSAVVWTRVEKIYGLLRQLSGCFFFF